MTRAEFGKLQVGDICEVIRGCDRWMRCIVLHKEQSEYERNGVPKSMVVLVKPLDPIQTFESSTVAYRYFKLIDHTNLKVLS